MQVPAALSAHGSPTDERHLFRYPIEPCPKVTVICDSLKIPAGCSRLREQIRLQPEILKTETLAAPASVLVSLPGGWMPQFPLVAFTGSRHGFLDEQRRDGLWRRFAVPVFEQLLDNDGRVFASECEAHAGLHVDDTVRHTLTGNEVLVNGRPTGIAAREANGLCGCGRVGPRLLQAGPIIRSVVVAITA
jgi:hypothetical protein